jgi:hypothetical protein
MARGHGEKLSRKQEQAIAALLEHPTILAAAAAIKVEEKTLRAWLELPSFKTAYRKARQRVLEAAIGRIQQTSSKAVDALERNLTCGRPDVEVRAAQAILQQAVQAGELTELWETVEALERRLGEGEQEPAPSAAAPADGGEGGQP